MSEPRACNRCGVCRGDCPATQAERDAAAVQVARRHAGHIDEPFTPHFVSEPFIGHDRTPDGDEYRRMISGG